MTVTIESGLGGLPRLYIDVERQMRYATSVALNKTAENVRDAIRGKMQQVFDRPTPYTLNALRIQRANRDALTAKVDFREASGKGIAADRYLGAQVYGGPRQEKRFEAAMRRTGKTARRFLVPGAGAVLDAYGNVSRGQIIQVLSYFEALGNNGYRANSTAKSRRRLAKLGKAEGGYKKIGGVQYFISRGKGTQANGRRQPLDAGVWRKTGIHGVDVKPVFLFVDQPQYRPLLPFYETAEEVFTESFDAQFDTALDAAISTARAR